MNFSDFLSIFTVNVNIHTSLNSISYKLYYTSSKKSNSVIIQCEVKDTIFLKKSSHMCNTAGISQIKLSLL